MKYYYDIIIIIMKYYYEGSRNCLSFVRSKFLWSNLSNCLFARHSKSIG